MSEWHAENKMKFVRPLSADYKPAAPMLFPFWTHLDLPDDTQGMVVIDDTPSRDVRLKPGINSLEN